MEKRKVIVKDKTLLELAEDAYKGDVIDLKEVVEVDTTDLEKLIESGKEKVYEEKLAEFKKRIDAENELKIKDYESKFNLLKEQHESDLKIKSQEIDKGYADQIAELNNKIALINKEKDHDLESLKSEKQTEIDRLNTLIDNIKKDNEKSLVIKEQEVVKNYSEQISELKNQIDLLNESKQTEIDRLNTLIDNIRKVNEKSLVIKEQEVAKDYSDQIAELKKQIDLLNETKKSDIETIQSKNEAERSKLIAEKNEKYSKLEQDFNVLKAQYDSRLKQVKNDIENEYSLKIKDIEANNKIELANKDAELQKKDSDFELERIKIVDAQKEKYDALLKEKEDIINNLQRAKAAMNVKQTGNDLEAWCDNEVTSYMQNGLFNCTWEQDTKNVREEDESKGSKADYIFKVYASNEHLDNELLASVCMDMKDENPDSVNKKTNSDYYKQLDKNREKKNCKYALLVSNLEMDKPNILPIFKVREYENMYVVRPAYLMTFLNMIASLTTRFSELILSKEAEELELKSKFALLEEFEEIKKTYLDKPLESLEKAIADITKNTESISKAVRNIDEQCDKINRSYINQIIEKINNYELKLNRSIVKKLVD